MSADFGPWALESDEFERLITRGEQAFSRYVAGVNEKKLTALEAYRAAREFKSQRLGVRDGTGVLYVEGALMKRESWLTGLLGLSTYETLRQDLQVALDEPHIRSIILRIDSPGGEVNGCSALAEAIYAARGKKPITAFVSGMACSAAYWIATAAERVVVSPASILGSIGVVLTVTDTRARDKQRGIQHRRIISTQSPNKQPDPATDKGRQQIVKMLDDMAEVFIKAVARNRNVSRDTVLTKFGAGGVEIGANAVKAGMADEVGQFEATLARLQAKAKPAPKTAAQTSSAAASAVSPFLAAASVAATPLQPSAEEQARAAEIARKRQQEATAAGWKRAADKANAMLGGAAVLSDDGKPDGKQPSGWAKAVANANRRFEDQ